MTAPEVIFVGNARDYHAMDWFRSAQRVCAPRPVSFATDLIESEGHTRLVTAADPIIPLLNVDRLLMRRQSRFGHLWRNGIKFLLLPIQAMLLRRVYRQHPHAAYHAHTMYYMLACAIAGVPFVGTPQGSEILVRPYRSRVYRVFARFALRRAHGVTVDSAAMAAGVEALSGRSAVIVQNGIDIGAIERVRAATGARSGVLSVRAIDPNYRIAELLAARDLSRARPVITLLHPFTEASYLAGIRTRLHAQDRDLGRVPREVMYGEMAKAQLVVSIPRSDSSPRSVYEAIFAGAPVAVAPNGYVADLPACMRARLIIVDLSDPLWLDNALQRARELALVPYRPSEEALDRFDQVRSMQRVASAHYLPAS